MMFHLRPHLDRARNVAHVVLQIGVLFAADIEGRNNRQKSKAVLMVSLVQLIKDTITYYCGPHYEASY